MKNPLLNDTDLMITSCLIMEQFDSGIKTLMDFII